VIRQAPPQFRAVATAAIHSAFASSMNDILLVGGIVALVGAAAGLALVRGTDFVRQGAPAPDPDPARAEAAAAGRGAAARP
jgi:hypothetical protein